MRDKSILPIKRQYYKASIPDFSGGINTDKDERILPLSRAKESYNFELCSGALLEGYGLESSGITNALCVWLYTRQEDSGAVEHILMYCAKDGKVYFRRGEAAFIQLSGVSFTSAPMPLNYRLYNEDVIILVSATDHMVVWNGKTDAYTVADSPLITSLTMHYERMFVTTSGAKNAVWFSDDLDPTNWNPELDEGGFIELLDERGRLNRVISFNNMVYVFRDYGISKISAYASQSDFNVSNLFVSSGRIYADTAVVCGDVIIFMAADGLYSFDGVSTRKMLKNLDGLLCGGGSPYACYNAGKYWVTFNACFEGETANKNNCVLALDRHSGAFSLIKGVCVNMLCPIADGDNEKLYMVCDDGRAGITKKDGVLFGTPLKKLWQSGLIDLNTPTRTKLIKEIVIDTLYDIELTVKTEVATKKIAVKGGSGIAKVRVNMTAVKLGLSIESFTAKASIARPTVTYALIK